ncbi:MAG: hypothetical protein OXF01_15140 [Gemmatimonadetes bacterium]|nr:hypothetical protein [Gemmatimonadota bacterium]
MRRLALLMVLASGAVVPLGTAAPAGAQEVAWQEEMRNPIRFVVLTHYARGLRVERSIHCLARKGDICFGGDYEDYRCLSISPCRTEAAMYQFMDELERAARRRPADPYTVAQAVYGLARVGLVDRALEVAKGCDGVDWWCDLVLGMAYHRAGRSVDADGHLRMGLLGADPELECRLTDIEYLLDGRDGSTYSDLPCHDPKRLEFEERFWWLSDPLMTMPGNDRWTEHVTRRFELLLHERLWAVTRPNYLVTARGISDNLVYMDVVTRRGPPDSWDNTGWFRSLDASRYRFSPASLVGDGIQALRYNLEATRWDEGYTSIEYGPVFEVPGQVARFLDGDSLVLAVSADLDASPVYPRESRFVASGGPAGPFVGRGVPTRDLGPSFMVTVEAVPLVVAVEAMDPDGPVARMRQGVMPLEPGALVISDPLLVSRLIPELPTTRQEAVDSMLAQAWIGSANEMVAYWEVYGLQEGQPMQISVALAREGAGMVTRVLRTLSGRSEPPAPVVSWTEEASGPVHPMSLKVDVDALRDGDYDLNLEVTGPDGSVATATRRFKVGRR